jgi:hypothetical protein
MKTSKLCRRIDGKQQNMIVNPGARKKIPEYKSNRLSLALLDIVLVSRGRTKDDSLENVCFSTGAAPVRRFINVLKQIRGGIHESLPYSLGKFESRLAGFRDGR